MKNIKIGMLILGIALILLGTVLFSAPIANTMVITYIACFLMLAYGIWETVHYFAEKKYKNVSGLVLADGIITIIFSIMLIFVPQAQAFSAAIIFAIWMLFTGCTRISAAFSAKDAGMPNWGWILVAGIIGVIVGTIAMLNPLYGILAIGFVVPITFIIQGVSALTISFYIGKDD